MFLPPTQICMHSLHYRLIPRASLAQLVAAALKCIHSSPTPIIRLFSTLPLSSLLIPLAPISFLYSSISVTFLAFPLLPLLSSAILAGF